MSISLSGVAFDTLNALALAQWWAKVLEVDVPAEASEWFTLLTLPSGMIVGFQKVPDPTPGKNKVHLDFGSENREAEVQRVTELGATVLSQQEFQGFSWTVLADPEGNQFCIS